MPSARDYQILAERDYKVCCKLEEKDTSPKQTM